MNSNTDAPSSTHIEKAGDLQVEIVREFDAPIDVVWDLYTDQSRIAEWMGPKAYRTIVHEGDFRVGGKWRYTHVDDATGSEYEFHGEFLEIERPHRIKQTFNFAGAPEVIDALEFVSIDDGRRTRLLATSTFQTTEARDDMVGAGMAKGVRETYERFDVLLAARG